MTWKVDVLNDLDPLPYTSLSPHPPHTPLPSPPSYSTSFSFLILPYLPLPHTLLPSPPSYSPSFPSLILHFLPLPHTTLPSPPSYSPSSPSLILPFLPLPHTPLPSPPSYSPTFPSLLLSLLPLPYTLLSSPPRLDFRRSLVPLSLPVLSARVVTLFPTSVVVLDYCSLLINDLTIKATGNYSPRMIMH